MRSPWMRPVALLGLAVLLPTLTGCYNTTAIQVEPSAAKESQLNKVLGVTTLDNGQVAFAEAGEVRDETVYGTVEVTSAEGTVLASYEIALSQVARLWFEERKMEWPRLFTGIAVITAGILAIIMDPEN